MRLEGWPQATAVQAAILRDARKGALVRMRSARVDPELIGFMESIHWFSNHAREISVTLWKAP